MTYGLFLFVCFTFQPCDYLSQGWIYPDEANCLADIKAQKLTAEYKCLPVDGVIRGK